MIERFRFLVSTVRKASIVYACLHDKKFVANRLLGEILRNTHSIEKGLSIENVRLGFGIAKIKEAFGFCCKYENLTGTMNVIPIMMFRDALVSYLTFHEENRFTNTDILEVQEIVNHLSSRLSTTFEHKGGYSKIERKYYTAEEQDTMCRLFEDRHSVREFAHTPIDENDLNKAIKLAMRCPSACNRQNYRLYIIDKNKFSLMKGWMDGIGGFANDIEKILLVTGRMSDFRHTEELQYLISPTVFASYLTLSLQIVGIGCCFIQRTIVPSRRNESMKSVLSIPADEQIVCALGIGNFKESYKVPISYRLPYNEIVTHL